MVVGKPEGPVLDLVPPRPQAEHEPAGAHFGDRRGHLREQARRVEACARDERAEPDALRHRGEAGEQRPDLPRPAFGPAVVPVQQVVAEPDRVEAGLLGGARHRGVLRPPDLALHLGQLHPDPERSSQRRLLEMCSRYCPEPGVASLTST